VRPPRTRVGWWSIALGTTHVGVSVIDRLVALRVADDAPGRPAFLMATEIVLIVVGTGTAVAVATALWRRGERSWMLGLPLVIGLGTVVLLLGAVFGPT
jgi:hypothetical protein